MSGTACRHPQHWGESVQFPVLSLVLWSFTLHVCAADQQILIGLLLFIVIGDSSLSVPFTSSQQAVAEHLVCTKPLRSRSFTQSLLLCWCCRHAVSWLMTWTLCPVSQESLMDKSEMIFCHGYQCLCSFHYFDAVCWATKMPFSL